ncbi:MAG: hypothetical protein ACR2IL_02870 [Chitinophagaceae bacterium]
MRLFCFIGCLILGLASCKPPQASDAPDAEVLLDSISILNIRLDSLAKTEVQGGDLEYWTQYSQTLNQLKEQGIEDPKTYVANALSERPELIPMKAVLGGKMLFTRIMLMGDHWAIAEFEDGHVGGEMLLSYTVDAKNNISWKSIQSHQVD